jgi:pimeloyl-ACP methyl ester carboxylesterase
MQIVHSVDGTALAYERAGEGPVLVIVNGGLADRTAGTALAEHLEPSFTVVRYDRRGRGESGDADEYEPQREVDDLAAIIDASGGLAHVYGHSSGEMLALRAATRDLPIDRLALYEPPFVASADAPRIPAGLVDELQDLLARGERAAAVVRFLVASVGVAPDAAEQIRDHDPAFPKLVAMANTLPYEAILAGDQQIPTSVTSVRAPTLVLSGGDSAPWMQESAQALAARIAGARHHTIEGQGHGVEADVIAPILTAFFRGGA